MKDIYEILKTAGIEIAEEQKKDFFKAFNENYKTVEEFNSKTSTLQTQLKDKEDEIAKRDKDIQTLNENLKNSAASEDAVKEAQAQLEKLKQDYENDKVAYEEKIKQQEYDSIVKEIVAPIKFSSEGAKKSFINDLKAKGLKSEEGKILGFDDFLGSYKEQDKGAFVEETPPSNDPPKPTFSSKTDSKPNPNTSGFAFNFTGVRQAPQTDK